MKAVVIRNAMTQSIVCMGPDNGMYDPVVPSGCTKAVEPDYERLIQEHLADMAAQPKPKTLEERVAALESKTVA